MKILSLDSAQPAVAKPAKPIPDFHKKSLLFMLFTVFFDYLNIMVVTTQIE